MIESEAVDQTLLIFYNHTKDGGICSISGNISVNGYELKAKELQKIKKILEFKNLVEFQLVKIGFKGQITNAGIIFVETNSFSIPGISILTLTDKKLKYTAKMTNDNCNSSGIVTPVIDWNKCEASGICLETCPYKVFELKLISDEQYSSLSFLGKLKAGIIGRERAFAVNPQQCHNCGLCVSSCPEQAIELIKVITK